MKYQLNINRIIAGSLPLAMRGDLIKLLSALMVQLKCQHSVFLFNKAKNTLDLSYNATRGSLQKLLNDRCDNVLRRITVGGSVQHLPIMLFPPQNNMAVLTPFVVRTASEYAISPFVVTIPSSFNNNKEAVVCKLLNEYKFLGTKYIIVRN